MSQSEKHGNVFAMIMDNRQSFSVNNVDRVIN